jgi:glycosyltransferase involved in cell wall biosynthesis
MNTLSVIIPTYNSERTIERAINSVLNQKGINELFKVELLICDDHSTDNTIKIVSKYPCKFFQNNYNSGGPNWGRNKGIKESTGDYIAFLDHDDEWLPDKLINQLNEINKGYEFIYSRCIKQVEQG